MCQNYENRLRVGKVIAKKAVCSFLAHPVHEYDRAALKQLEAEPNNDIRQRNNEVMNQQVLA